MNAMTRKLTRVAGLEVELGEDKAGKAQPRIELRFATDVAYRGRRAALLALAAEIEMATRPTEHWTVELLGGHHETGRVYLDLIDGTEDEAERGLQLLRRVVR